MTGVTAVLVISVPVLTWLCTRARWRNRLSEAESRWASVREQLVEQIGRLQDEVLRARARAAQVGVQAAAWADGYASGRNDMIRAAAALHGQPLAAGEPTAPATVSG